MNQNLIRFPTWRRTTLRRMNAAFAVPEWTFEALGKCLYREAHIEDRHRIVSLSMYRYRKTGFFMDFVAAIDE